MNVFLTIELYNYKAQKLHCKQSFGINKKSFDVLTCILGIFNVAIKIGKQNKRCNERSRKCKNKILNLDTIYCFPKFYFDKSGRFQRHLEECSLFQKLVSFKVDNRIQFKNDLLLQSCYISRNYSNANLYLLQLQYLQSSFT